MLSFENDYSEGALPYVLERLFETNWDQLSGYGSDPYTESAKEKIRCAFDLPHCEIFFLAGGTQTNQIAIDALLHSYEGVVAADTGHISVHEAGAIEYCGHKMLTLPHKNGKISPADLKQYMADFLDDANHDHMVFPGMVYISHPTEYGTLYTRDELRELSEICKMYSMPLYLDGARLGYGLMAEKTDVTASDIGKYCDSFYIGGTKVGALMGEALVFTDKAPKQFMTIVKQHGALLAKGRVCGVQFDALFTDGLYFTAARNAIDKAKKLDSILSELGFRFYIPTETNQLFVTVENSFMEKLARKVKFSFWEKYSDTESVIRFATSWATTDESIYKLEHILKGLML